MFDLNSNMWGRHLLFATARIWTSLRGGDVAGTAFFVEGQLVDGGPIFAVLVTNRHVVEGGGVGEITVVGEKDGEPDLGSEVRMPYEESDWVLHPDESVDVAVLAVGRQFARARELGTPGFLKVLTRDMWPDSNELSNLDVVEPVVFFGYPNGLYDTANGTPIARRGFTATPVQFDFGGKPTFLIDGSVFEGSSGSPVFAVHEHGFRDGKTIQMGRTRLLFLGLISDTQLTRRAEGESVPLNLTERLDLGVVTKWSALDPAIDLLAARFGVDRTAGRGSA